MLLYAFYDTDLLYKNATYKTLTQCFVMGELMATTFLLTFGLALYGRMRRYSSALCYDSTHILGAFTIFSTIFIERSCAVYFIKDYEYVDRPLIEAYLHLQSFSMQSFSVMVYSFTGGYYDALTFKLNLPFMTLWLITVWFLFRNVYIENNRALNQLFETWMKTGGC
ncbi:unnamed protein product, partial [Mesorhabditis spiculigera]